jgi:hypothetical protein
MKKKKVVENQPVIQDLFGEPITPVRRKKKQSLNLSGDGPSENKWRDDLARSFLYHAKAGELLKTLAPDHFGDSYSRTDGRYYNNRYIMANIKDTVLGRSNTPIDENLRTGCDSLIKFYRHGDARKGGLPEVLRYAARYHKSKGFPFALNAPRAGGLIETLTPLGLAPFPERVMWDRKLALQYIRTYLKLVVHDFVLIDMVGPSIDNILWIWIKRVDNLPDECLDIYSVVGIKRNRVLVVGDRGGYLPCDKNYVTTTLTEKRRIEPKETLIEMFTPPEGYEPHNGLFLPDDYHKGETDAETILGQWSIQRTCKQDERESPGVHRVRKEIRRSSNSLRLPGRDKFPREDLGESEGDGTTGTEARPRISSKRRR